MRIFNIIYGVEMYKSVEQFMEGIKSRNPGEKEFHQAVFEVVDSIWDFLKENPHYLHSKILERICSAKVLLLILPPSFI